MDDKCNHDWKFIYDNKVCHYLFGYQYIIYHYKCTKCGKRKTTTKQNNYD